MSYTLNSIGQIEHERIPFVDAVAAVDTFNGAMGTVSDGKFTPGVGTTAIMQVECGDDAGMPKYPIAKGTHVRVVDFEKCKGNLVNIYDYPLPATFAVGNKLEADTDGSLKVNASPTGTHLEIKEIIGNKQGVIALITKAEA